MVINYDQGLGNKPDPFEFCKEVVNSCYQLTGLFYSTMNRGESWHFGRLGMLLERADKTSRILDVKYYILLPDPAWVGSAYDNTQWAALLKAVSGLEMYRKIYRRINPIDVARFLIYDPLFPRSILHCVRYAEDSLAMVSGETRNKGLNDAQKSIYRLRTALETGTVEEAMKPGLHLYLDTLQSQLNQVDTEIYKTYFALKISTRGGYEHGHIGQHQS
jgi:uncharacterized alpha-E superfamily protein